MLNQETITEAILLWLKEFVEKPHPSLGGWSPCPFARQARLNKTYRIEQGTNVVDDGVGIADNWDESKEVVIVWYDNSLSSDEISNLTLQLNQIIMPKNMVALAGHPELEETINGIDMRFKLCPIIVLQQLDKLNQAADQLKSKGYYDHWNQAELDNIVSWRYKS
jgi:hypothetical protein